MSNIILVGMKKGDEILPSLPILPRWKGKNVAVHATLIPRPDLDFKMGPAPKNYEIKYRWRVTHLLTGFSAARFTTLSDAMKVAKMFDSLFIQQNAEEMKQDTDFVELFTETVKTHNGILCSYSY